MKTYTPKMSEVKKRWFVVDAKNKILGRLATKVATFLMGKNKPLFFLNQCSRIYRTYYHIDAGIMPNSRKGRFSWLLVA